MQTVIPRSYIENYSNALNLASDTAKKALIEALAAVDYTQPVDKIRDAVIAIMQVACGASTSVAARLAADFYDGLRVYMVGDAYGAIAESMRNPAATEGAIRAFIQIIVDGGDVDEFVKMCADRLDYENRKAAKECVAENAKNDPRQTKWAIVPTGDETCPYCIILASRGFVYDNEEMASHTHANCDCRLVPAWSDDPIVQGYQAKLAEYEAFYKECEGMRNNPDMPEDLRLRIQLAKMRHDADYRAGIVKNKWSSMNELTIIARYLHPEGFINSAVEVGEVVGSKPLFEWTAAKSKKEAIKYLNQFGFETISTGFTIDELNEISHAFTEYFNKFPFMVGSIDTIKSGKMKACAYYSSGEERTKFGNKVFRPFYKFNRASIRSVESDCEYCCNSDNFKTGYRWWSTKKGIDGLVMHEGTHALEYKLLMQRCGIVEGEELSPVESFKFRQRRGEVSKEIVTAGFERCGIDYTDENICKYISEYGSKNTLETLAEALSCEDDANIVCNAIKEVLHEMLVSEGLLL